VGIIDLGHIVAEGTPAALKSEIGRPTLEAIPINAEDHDAVEDVLLRFGDPCAGGTSAKGISVRVRNDNEGLADVVRALDAAGVEVSDLRVHQPTLDDVFLAKTGRSLEGAGAEADAAAPETGAGEAEPEPAPA
jgi:ABC-2 type transport system ATP-binding protein